MFFVIVFFVLNIILLVDYIRYYAFDTSNIKVLMRWLFMTLHLNSDQHIIIDQLL